MRKKRKTQIIVLSILVLFLLPMLSQTEFLSSSDDVFTRDIESQFSIAADGAESDQSIDAFSSTLSSDTMFYPDAFLNDTTVFADAGSSGTDDPPPIVQTGSYADTAAVDGTNYVIKEDNAGITYIYLNVTVPTYATIEGFDYSTYAFGQYLGPSTYDSFRIYDFTNEVWVLLSNLPGDSLGWVNGTTYNPDYWDTVIMFWFDFQIQELIDGNGGEVDYLGLEFYVLHLGDSEHYAESFADVSEINTTLGETVTTDNDLGTFHHPGDNAWDYYYWNAPSALAVQVIEYRCHSNISSSSYEFALYSADDGGGSQLWTSGSITAPTSAATKKYSPMVTGVESIRLGTRHASSPASFIFDYLRASKSNESGWAHDGSTTAGVDTSDAGSGAIFSLSTDGDILNMTVTRPTGSTGQVILDIDLDNTATSAKAEYDYYPFFETYFSISASGCTVGWDIETDGYRSSNTTTNSGWWTYRWNCKAFTTANALNRIVWWSSGFEVGDSFTILFDYGKLYSIANYSYSGSSVTTDDYLYVDSGVLHSNVDSGYIELNHDPALSVTDTYSVWNLTTSTEAPEFSQYVSEWSTYSAETRGATTSGTVTDIKLKFDSTEILSAIKFIEDGTNPTVIRSNVNPPEPDDDETVTLSSVITDGVEVYSVKYNALVYPAGFSDVDYSATETATNFWTYSFSSGVLPTGYYSFSVIANDGANENGLLTEPEYIDFTVRVSEIRITPITFFGVGDDFSQMQLSFEINKDCSYTIYEASDSVAETDTHTGSVSEGWDNIAWDKLTTTDTAVNFSISFVSGSLSTWINGSYAVAQVVFDVVLSDKTTTFDYVYLEGESTKAAAYAVYDINNVLRGSGTIPEGSFALSFEIWNKKSLTETFYGVKFTNGSSTDWINGTYYADDPEEYKGGGVVTVPPWWQDPMTWVIIGGGFALVMIMTTGRKEGDLPNAPKGLK